MSSQRLHGGLITLCLLLSCRLSVAIDPGAYPNSTNPAAIGPTGIGSPGAIPAAMALPANVGPLSGDASTHRKFYTLTASLREVYDDNVFTSPKGSAQTAYETDLSPSVLVDFPVEGGDFSARYTFDLTYYNYAKSSNNNSVGNGNSPLQYTHEFVAQYTHPFSDRFNLNLAEQARYFTEPSLFESVGTNYRDGAYISNAINGTASAQWTPLFGTVTTYANTIVDYQDPVIAAAQNSIENTGSQSFSFAVLPKISASFGGIVDDLAYQDDTRGYTNYTAFLGLQWQALPSLSVNVRGGGAYTETVGSQSSGSLSPYGALSVAWTLGARSMLSFDYSHEVAPTDQPDANGEISDRFSSNFRYDITPSLSAHLQGIITDADISEPLISSNAISGYTEYDYALDTGLTYHWDKYLDFDAGITLTGVDSELSSFDYTRDQAYLGVRGTY
jgi:hypothetical protein